MSSSISTTCKGCKKQFNSKNLLFRHLKQSAKICLPPDEYEDFRKNVLCAQREKIGVLYGYLPGSDYRLFNDNAACDAHCGVEGGHHAAWLVTQAIDRVSRGVDGDNVDISNVSWSADAAANSKINRSYGCTSRESQSVAQDAHTGAITELLCTTALPFFVEDGDDDGVTSKQKTKKWVESVNGELERILAHVSNTRSNKTESNNDLLKWSAGRIRVFGRHPVQQKKFNAETDVTHRRVDYCFPADLLFSSTRGYLSESAVQPVTTSLQEFSDSLPSFPPGNTPSSVVVAKINRPDKQTLDYLYEMKKVLKLVTTQVEEIDDKDSGAILDKKFHDEKRKKKKRKGAKNTSAKSPSKNNEIKKNEESRPTESSTNNKESNFDKDEDSKPLSSQRVLKRKRFHNFCPNILAHDFLAYRRVDRVFHRGTIRLDKDMLSGLTMSHTIIKNRPFVVFSLSGDLFLHEQTVRIMGVLIAILRGEIDEDIIELLFDEEYSMLAPAPPAPSIGLIAAEACYMTWEGRMKAILTARRTDRYDAGMNAEEVVQAAEEWEKSILNDVALSWYHKGIEADGRLGTETHWLNTVLRPWAKKTQVLLEDYRSWRATSLLPPIESIDTSVPTLYQKVLHHLREADASGQWPSTTPGRQLVMLSTAKDGSQIQSLSSARMAYKKNLEARSCAYSFKEGQGGASGSFSVGAMPGAQPKGNSLFPELTRACFELEIALCPDREPSSTIAINRNAAFRPHTDKGTGAGQSTSLIVGLGDYTGGELMVEGEKKDIRYNAVEFNGWKQRQVCDLFFS